MAGSKPTNQHLNDHRVGQSFTPDERAAAQNTFLTAFARTGNVSQSARRARVHRATLYEWREQDSEFRIRWDEAVQEADDVLRAEIFRRGVTGVLDPVYQMGREVGQIRRYSNQLLIFLAKARMAEFRDKQELSGPNGGEIVIRYVNDWRNPDPSAT